MDVHPTKNGINRYWPIPKSVKSQVLDGSNSSNSSDLIMPSIEEILWMFCPGGAEASDSQWQDALRGDQIAAGLKWWFSLISNDFEKVNWINHGIYGIGDLFWWLSSFLTGPGLFEVLARNFVWERLQKATKASNCTFNTKSEKTIRRFLGFSGWHKGACLSVWGNLHWLRHAFAKSPWDWGAWIERAGSDTGSVESKDPNQPSANICKLDYHSAPIIPIWVWINTY
jgi:hypothetical protein